jgi:hypothetical protein
LCEYSEQREVCGEVGEETTYELAKIGEPIIPGNCMAVGYSPGSATENWESYRPGPATTVALDWPTIIFLCLFVQIFWPNGAL